MQILEFTPPTSALTSRPRADETVAAMLPHLRMGMQVALDLQSDIISMSFLDEIVRRLLEEGHLGDVIFSVHAQDTIDKLSRIADVRAARILYRGVNTEKPRPIAATSSSLSDWTFEGRKAAS